MACSVSMLTVESKDSARVTATLYSWNTVGAILGALLMGFYILPTFEFANSIRILTVTSLSLALVACVLYWRNYAIVAIVGPVGG